MFSFEGDFRRKPEQNLAGASKRNEKSALLEHVQLERMKREEFRKRNNAALKIQAQTRSYLIRKSMKKKSRSQFDYSKSQLNTKYINFDLLIPFIKNLHFFYEPIEDSNRFIWVLEQILANKKYILINHRDWIWNIKWTLKKSIEFIVNNSNGNNNNNNSNNHDSDNRDYSSTIPLRVLEVFILTCDEYIDEINKKIFLRDILLYLINNSYFIHFKKLLDEHLASVPLPSSSSSTTAASSSSVSKNSIQLTPRIKCYLNLMKQPLEYCFDSEEYYIPVLSDFIMNILITKSLNSIKLIKLLKLNNWPYGQLLYCINKLIESKCKLIEPNIFVLYSILLLEPINFTLNDDDIFLNYIKLLGYLSYIKKASWNIIELNKSEFEDDGLTSSLQVNNYKNRNRSVNNDGGDDDDDEDGNNIGNIDNDDDNNDVVMNDQNQIDVLKECMLMLNNEDRVHRILNKIDNIHNNKLVYQYLCELCDNLLQTDRLATHKYKLIYMLAFKPTFLRRLWNIIISMKSNVQMITRGIPPNEDETNNIIPLLAVFFQLFSLLIATLHDTEFFRQDNNELNNEQYAMPFTIKELIPMSAFLKDICLGLIEIAFSDSRPTIRHDYKNALNIDSNKSSSNNYTNKKCDNQKWIYLFKVSGKLLRQLNTRDLRRQFCPDGHWISSKPELDLILQRRRGVLLKVNNDCNNGPPLSIKELRALILLKKIPFIVSFNDRVMVLQSLIQKDKLEQQGELTHFMQGPSIHISVRRNYLYEDALDKLSPENEPELRLKMRVQLYNSAGMEEAGVDGGGLFREFLSELLKTSFDPNRGFFKITKDNMLYPNPTVHLLIEDFPKHYYFIGRMLGKAIYENLLVELPFAEFFLSKITGRQSDVDIHHLDSLDPVMYRNLLYLKSYKGDVTDLGLDFTVLSDELGERTIEELKPKGAQIPVNNTNRIEYIHLMADYKLNKQIRPQCYAFKQGIANVIPLEWLQMFNSKEMQILISGAETPVDVEDLKRFTNYTGGYGPEHPTIIAFWKVVYEFTSKQKGQLLKFVTSCSRPPLLGFKELDPPFCIQHAGTVDRLPTSSTCMNLLKLPEFPDESTLREKLLYAIQAGAGFELS